MATMSVFLARTSSSADCASAGRAVASAGQGEQAKEGAAGCGHRLLSGQWMRNCRRLPCKLRASGGRPRRAAGMALRPGSRRGQPGRLGYTSGLARRTFHGAAVAPVAVRIRRSLPTARISASGRSGCRMPLVVPETSLWFNLEVAAARFPDKAGLRVLRPRAELSRQLRAQAEAHRRLAAARRRAGTGDRVAVFMQNCPQFSIALYGILRANAVVVPVNPMNRAEELKHYIDRPGDARSSICSADLAADRRRRRRRRCPRRSAPRRVLVTRYTDAMPDGPLDEADAPTPAHGAWLRADVELPAGFVRWTRRARRGPRARARTPRRPTTWRCCPTPRAPPACPRAACTRTAR